MTSSLPHSQAAVRRLIVLSSAILAGLLAGSVGLTAQAMLNPAQAAPLFLGGLALILIAALVIPARTRSILQDMAVSDLALDRTMAELVNARDRANAASIAKSQFLANMSHEIRTPLNGILGMAQVMKLEPLEPGQRERLDIISSSGQTLLSVLNDLLDLSKIEAGRLALERGAFDLDEMVNSACAGFSEIARQKAVAFTIEVAEPARGVWCADSGRIRQVLSNLLSNAVKFTDQGEITVRVRPTAQGLRFEVLDTGIGVAADRLKDLFQRFSQIDASNTRRYGGAGLGLAISRELVELMGGRVDVASVPGEGSTFSFEIPVDRASS